MAKAPKITLKSLQNEIKIIKDELECFFKAEAKSVKHELDEVKEELKKGKDKEQLKESECGNKNQENRENIEKRRNCNICANNFNSKNYLMLHVREKQ